MVETTSTYIHKILGQLEKFLIWKNGFHLLGKTYDLILLIPSERYSSDAKYSLMISAKSLDNYHQKDIIKEIFTVFKNTLEVDEFNSIARINVIHSEDSFVRNLKQMFGFREEIFELNSITVGGVHIEFAYLVKSLVLDKLVEKRAVTLEVIDSEGSINQISAGVKRINEDFFLVYYTGKGLRELFGQEMTAQEKLNAEILIKKGEQFLMENQFIAQKRLDDILRVL